MTPSVYPEFNTDKGDFGRNLSEGFHLLKAHRRRRVVWYLSQVPSGEETTVRELAKQIAAAEQDTVPRRVVNADYRTVYTNLVQHHLPALEQANVIQYDQDRQIVQSGPNLSALTMMLAVAIPSIHLLLATDLEEQNKT